MIHPPRPIDFSLFQKVCLTIGQVVEVKQNPSALQAAYLMKLAFSESLNQEHKTLYKKNGYSSSAQLCANHRAEDLVNQKLLAIINFPRKQIGKSMSDCLTIGVQKETNDSELKKASTVFVKPSSDLVPLGSKVSLLAEEEIFETNPRNLNWAEFFCLDLRIGTLLECQGLIPLSETINKVFFGIDLGEGLKRCVSLLHHEISPDHLIGKQVLVLTNLSDEDKSQQFDASPDDVILCTIAGRSVLEPALPVENGFKLA